MLKTNGRTEGTDAPGRSGGERGRESEERGRDRERQEVVPTVWTANEGYKKQKITKIDNKKQRDRQKLKSDGHGQTEDGTLTLLAHTVHAVQPTNSGWHYLVRLLS